jgi:DNA-binding LytR/AlgR family response regulator
MENIMLLKVAICDDEPKDANIISSYLQRFEIKEDIDFETSIFNQSKDLLQQCTHPGIFHILFLDVEMPNINGIELARLIRIIDQDVKVVFISNYPHYMQDSFPVHPTHYLTKPLSETRFQDLMYQIIKEYEKSHIYKIILQTSQQEELVNINDIFYITSQKTKKGFLSFVINNVTLESRGNLKDWENELAPYHFISPHRGLLVNLNKIHYIKDTTIILDNGEILPLSRRKEKDFRSLFSRHLITINKH